MGATKKISIELGVLDYLPTFWRVHFFNFKKNFFTQPDAQENSAGISQTLQWISFRSLSVVIIWISIL